MVYHVSIVNLNLERNHFIDVEIASLKTLTKRFQKTSFVVYINNQPDGKEINRRKGKQSI